MKTKTCTIAILLAAGLINSHAQDTWTQKTDFGGVTRAGATGFSIGSKGYIGLGDKYPISYKDFWEYDPSTNAWTQKADFGGHARLYAVGFTIAGKAYVGTGQSGTFPNYTYHKDF
jgi:N-acetylneuraminic acid mutarotase